MIQGWEILVPYFDLDRRIPNATLLLGGERGQDDNHWGLKIMLKTLSTMVSFMVSSGVVALMVSSIIQILTILWCLKGHRC